MLKRVVFVGQEPMTRDHIWAPLAHEFELMDGNMGTTNGMKSAQGEKFYMSMKVYKEKVWDL